MSGSEYFNAEYDHRASCCLFISCQQTRQLQWLNENQNGWPPKHSDINVSSFSQAVFPGSKDNIMRCNHKINICLQFSSRHIPKKTVDWISSHLVCCILMKSLLNCQRSMLCRNIHLDRSMTIHSNTPIKNFTKCSFWTIPLWPLISSLITRSQHLSK